MPHASHGAQRAELSAATTERSAVATEAAAKAADGLLCVGATLISVIYFLAIHIIMIII
jgi:hypothetical protein